MDIADLKCIITVSECLSINKASVLLYKSQPQISRLVKSFEELVGQIVFERTTRGLKITPRGKEILNYCQDIVRQYDEMVNLSAKYDNIQSFTGKINIYNTAVIHSFLFEVLGNFHANYPSIHLNITTLSADDIIDSILRDPESISLFTQIYLNNGKKYYYIPELLRYIELARFPLYALCSENSIYAKQYKSISLKTLSTLPLLEYKPFSNDLSLSATFFSAFGIPIDEFAFSTDDIRIIERLLVNGHCLYLGISPSHKILKENITYLPVNDKVMCGFGLLISHDFSNNPITNLLYQHMISAYQKIY